jgi:nucleotide-binding universal stress UspA family protein
MYKTVLVPLDGSRLSEQAVEPAVALCRRWAARLHLVHVRTHAKPAKDADIERAHFDSTCERASDALGESVSFAIIEGLESHLRGGSHAYSVAQRIETYAENNEIDLVVMATHGRGGLGRAWFGSTTDALLRISATPLLLVRSPDIGEVSHWTSAHPVRRVLLPLNGTRLSLDALEPGHRMAVTFGAGLTLLRVIVPPQTYEAIWPGPALNMWGDVSAAVKSATAQLNALGGILRADALDVEVKVIADPMPARAILDYEHQHDVDLIVLATKGAHGFDRVLIGSVADKVIRGADCPVLVVRSDAVGEDPAFQAEEMVGHASN